MVYGGTCTLQEDPHWRDYLLFYEASGLLQTFTANLAGFSLGAPRSSVASRPGWSPALVVGPVLIMGPYTLTRARLNRFACWRKRHGPGSGPPVGKINALTVKLSTSI